MSDERKTHRKLLALITAGTLFASLACPVFSHADGLTKIQIISDRIRPEETEKEETPETENQTIEAISGPVLSLEEFQSLHTLGTYYALPQNETWAELETELTSALESYEGTWSLCLVDLKTEERISLQNRSQSSASLIKLYIMGAVLERLESMYEPGILYADEVTDTELKEVLDNLSAMITISSNTAANDLVAWLSRTDDHEAGLESVNSFIDRHGFSDTHQYNGLDDSDLWYDSAHTNRTSAEDCADFLSQVYEGTLVSHLASRYMEELLQAQEILYKIPSVLPEAALTANKTGETDEAENDAAIVYSAGGDYILVIMSADFPENPKKTAVSCIRELSEMVYAHFNPVSSDPSETETASETETGTGN